MVTTTSSSSFTKSIKDGLSMEELRGWAITMLQAYAGHDNPTPSNNNNVKNGSEQAGGGGDVNSMNDLLRQAREGEVRTGKAKWTERLQENDPELLRIDLSSTLLRDLTDEEKEQFLEALPQNETVNIVHLSGLQLNECMTEAEVARMVEGVGQLKNLEELFIFRGGSWFLTEQMVARCIEAAKHLKVIMIWGYGSLGEKPELAAALRRHQSLERITITLPKKMAYACMDLYVMGFAEMPRLHCLNMRGSGKQQEPVISPEAISILLASSTIESLYLENLGLIDDHTDAICEELRSNETLGLLDLKDNNFSDDAMYTFAQTLPHNQALQSLDLSGVQVTDRAGIELAKGLSANTTLTHLELEGTADKYADEFDIQLSHDRKEWYVALDYQLRLNRAGSTGNRKKFVEALNSVSDHLGCLYTFVRQSPQYCDLSSPLSTNLPI